MRMRTNRNSVRPATGAERVVKSNKPRLLAAWAGLAGVLSLTAACGPSSQAAPVPKPDTLAALDVMSFRYLPGYDGDPAVLDQHKPAPEPFVDSEDRTTFSINAELIDNPAALEALKHSANPRSVHFGKTRLVLCLKRSITKTNPCTDPVPSIGQTMIAEAVHKNGKPIRLVATTFYPKTTEPDGTVAYIGLRQDVEAGGIKTAGVTILGTVAIHNHTWDNSQEPPGIASYNIHAPAI